MKILEVSAIPPIVYAPSWDAPDNLADLVRSNIAWVCNGFKEAENTILRSNPIPRQMQFTNLHAFDLAGVDHVTKLGTQWFIEDKNGTQNTNYNVTISGVNLKGDLIGDLTACNMHQNALNYWEVPDEYISAANSQLSPYRPDEELVIGVGEASAITRQGSISYTPPTQIYNNKARYFQSVRIRVYSPASGESLEKNIYDVLPQTALPGAVTYNLAFAVGADIRPQGCPIFSWTYNDGGTDQRSQLTEYIKGGKWIQLALTNTGLPGSYFEKLTNRNNKADAILGAGLALGGGLLMSGIGGTLMNQATSGMMKGLNGPAPEMFSQSDEFIQLQNKASMGGRIADVGWGSMKLGAAGFALSAWKLGDMEASLNKRGICASTPQFTNNSDYAKDTNNNGFRYVITRYNDQDMVDYDAFLEKFGYNVGNMMFGTQHFWSRKSFIFMRINDITIHSDTVGRQILDKVEQQLKQGVRIWRTKVNINAMNPGGNREKAWPV